MYFVCDAKLSVLLNEDLHGIINLNEIIVDILTLLSFQNFILTELKQNKRYNAIWKWGKNLFPLNKISIKIKQLSNQLEGWNALPAETLSKIKMIKSDSALLPSQKQEQIYALIDGLPDKVFDMIPDPPEFSKIPKVELIKQAYF